jgi:hypothetical protein
MHVSIIGITDCLVRLQLYSSVANLCWLRRALIRHTSLRRLHFPAAHGVLWPCHRDVRSTHVPSECATAYVHCTSGLIALTVCGALALPEVNHHSMVVDLNSVWMQPSMETAALSQCWECCICQCDSADVCYCMQAAATAATVTECGTAMNS